MSLEAILVGQGTVKSYLEHSLASLGWQGVLLDEQQIVDMFSVIFVDRLHITAAQVLPEDLAYKQEHSTSFLFVNLYIHTEDYNKYVHRLTYK